MPGDVRPEPQSGGRRSAREFAVRAPVAGITIVAGGFQAATSAPLFSGSGQRASPSTASTRRWVRLKTTPRRPRRGVRASITHSEPFWVGTVPYRSVERRRAGALDLLQQVAVMVERALSRERGCSKRQSPR